MNPVATLAALAGRWRGTNTLHDPGTGRPEESPSELVLTPAIGVRFVRLDYTWVHRGSPQEGSLLIGFDPEAGEASGHWVDSWHMGPKALACRGAAPVDGVISLHGSWAAPPGPDWGWRIDLAPEGDGLRITHTVIDAEGTEDRAVEAHYRRP